MTPEAPARAHWHNLSMVLRVRTCPHHEGCGEKKRDCAGKKRTS
jgi:hypothetical protein